MTKAILLPISQALRVVQQRENTERKYGSLAASAVEQSHMQSSEGAGDRWLGNQRQFEL